ncbi:MAG: CRISPR-associated helicase Cas3' [Clostridia bacterium]
MLYAKSDPKETIKEHTDELLERLKILKELYGEEILKNKDIKKDNFWNMLRLVCIYHDAGKSYTPFQNMILEKLQEPLKETELNNSIKHEQLSPLFLPEEEIMKLSEQEEKVLTQVIFYHHERNSTLLDKEKISTIIVNDILPRIDEIEQELNVIINKKPSNYYLGYVVRRIKEGEKGYIQYCLIKGLLHRLDHSASAHVKIEDETTEKVGDFIEQKMEEKGFHENNLQGYCRENCDENMVVIGSTGMGKTEAGLLWSNGCKTFFTLPIRISINAIYDRISEEYQYPYVGLLHSSSLDYLESKNNDEGYESNELHNEEARNLSKKITTCTIDQIFTFVFKYTGYEKIYATLSYSKVIIDEIQAYSPEIVAVILKGLEMIHKIGGRFLIMTATLPRIYKDKLIEMGIPFKSNRFLSSIKRHKIKIEEKEVLEDVDNIIEKSKNKKVLIMVNTVDKAIEVYKKIKEKTEKVYTIHSRFIVRDREEKERNIKDFAQSTDVSGIWITTQIVEASIDIDFDYLYTEMSTLDSLFQRLGRCYRKREWTDNEFNVHIYTKNVSGIGYVYDKEIYQKSLEILKKYDENILLETDKVNMVDFLYAKENLEGTDFIKKFEAGLNVLNHMTDYDTNKKDAQKLLRNIENVKVVPKSIYDENKDLFEKYKIEKDKQERRRLKLYIEKLTTNISNGQLRTVKDKIFDVGFDNIKGIDMKYESETGLILKQSLDDDIEARTL